MARDEHESATALLWSLEALRQVRDRLAELKADLSNARDAYIGAVQGVWWVCALDEQSWEFERLGYSARRAASPDGRTVNGLKWVRDRHTHQLPLSVAKDETPFFPGPPFHLVPDSFVWAPRHALQAGPPSKDHDKHGWQSDYDNYVGGQSVPKTLSLAIRWFESEAAAPGSLMHHASAFTPSLPDSRLLNRRDAGEG